MLTGGNWNHGTSASGGNHVNTGARFAKDIDARSKTSIGEVLFIAWLGILSAALFLAPIAIIVWAVRTISGS